MSSTRDRRNCRCRRSAASATVLPSCSCARRRAVWIAMAAWLTATRSRCVSIADGKSLRPVDTSTRPDSHGNASGRRVTRNAPISCASISVVVMPGGCVSAASSASAQFDGHPRPRRPPRLQRPADLLGVVESHIRPVESEDAEQHAQQAGGDLDRLVVDPHRRQREKRAHVAKPSTGFRNRGVTLLRHQGIAG